MYYHLETVHCFSSSMFEDVCLHAALSRSRHNVSTGLTSGIWLGCSYTFIYSSSANFIIIWSSKFICLLKDLFIGSKKDFIYCMYLFLCLFNEKPYAQDPENLCVLLPLSKWSVLYNIQHDKAPTGTRGKYVSLFIINYKL